MGAVREGEFEALLEELLDVWAADIGGLLNLDDLENLMDYKHLLVQHGACETYVDRPEASTVTGGHVLVECVNGIHPGQLTVLLVHVVGAGAGVVANPDTEVLDLLWSLLVDLPYMLVASLGLDRGLSAHTGFKDTISPVAFLILRSLPKKYQNLDLATTSFGAKMRMR